ncbi:unnamed protein product [Mytilus coruscus]|uniref:YqaJ viral recombinase domain-containing protein n=1 Tax=Mytilus coruscus TaxID=42192 RepID=A0A6J8DEG9_MYTCO|nr:unnamed protein product [Mytilus coruscus]
MTRRYKRKIKSAKESTAASSKKHYGPEAIQVEADISSEELDKRKQHATRHGLSEERTTIKEYIQYKLKQNVHVKVERMGLVIDKTHKFLAGSPDGKVTEEEIGSPPSVGLIEIKNVLYRKDTSFTDAVKQVKNFCLELKEKKLQVKRSHNNYYQCQGLLNFVSRSSPNLENQPSTSTSHDKSRKRKSDQNLDSCLSNISPAASNTVTLKRSRRKCSRLKFVGRRISHEWIEDDGTSKWYKGTVTAVIDKNDGDEDAEYEVHYENHEEANIVDHLNEDFKKGSLKFIDI